MAYACLLDAVRSLSLLVRDSENKDNAATAEQLVNSSWCGILAALSLLLDSSTDDGSTENILKVTNKPSKKSNNRQQ